MTHERIIVYLTNKYCEIHMLLTNINTVILLIDCEFNHYLTVTINIEMMMHLFTKNIRFNTLQWFSLGETKPLKQFNLETIFLKDDTLENTCN